MLKKLLKYDLKYMIKNMGVFYILAFLFAIVSRIFLSLNSTPMLKILTGICVGCMFSMLASILMNTLMRSWVRFRDSIYKDEAYLTHTLPVSKDDIYNSKFIEALIFFVISFVVILACIFITYYTPERWDSIRNLISTITTTINYSTFSFVVIILLILFFEIFNMLQCGFIGIILGHKKSSNKVGYSVLFGFIIYTISQALVLAFIFGYGLFNNNIMKLFMSNTKIDINSIKLLLILCNIIYVFIIGGMNVISRKIFRKGVNVE